MKKVDVAIIGGGSAGLTAYNEVLQAGHTALLINEGEDGTTCARVGCMPSKAFIQIAQDFARTKTFFERGVENSDQLKVNFTQLMYHVRNLRDHFVDEILEKIQNLKENYLKGNAKLICLNRLEVNGKIIEAERIILATGSRPYIPHDWEEFSSYFLTTDNFFELKEPPKSLAIIGLGSVGLEIGLALSQLGVKVTGFSHSEFIGGLSDPEVNDVAKKIIEKDFPIILNQKITLSQEKSNLIITCDNKEYIFEKALITIGRRPNLDCIDFQQLGLPLDIHGVPIFDPHTMGIRGTPIFLAGDIVADKAVLPQAVDEGFIAGYNAANKVEQAFVRRCDLLITFTDPAICVIGKHHSTLENENFICGEARFENQGRAVIMSRNQGLIKIYGEPGTGKIIGAEIICPEGEHVAHLIAFCIQQHLTAAEAIKLPFYHPVIEESLHAALKDMLVKIYTLDKQALHRLDFMGKHTGRNSTKAPHISTKEDFKNILALGLYTPSLSIATGDLRNDSLQSIMGVLAHIKFPANKEGLINCARERNAEKEVIEFINELPSKNYGDLSTIISESIRVKLRSTVFPNGYNLN